MSSTVIELPPCTPFHRNNWSGKIWALDDTPTTDFVLSDLKECLFSGDTGDGWDGKCAAICVLHDGRFISWETFWGPTGDGFNEDAYGGDADIFVSNNLIDAAMLGLSPEARRLCGYDKVEAANVR